MIGNSVDMEKDIKFNIDKKGCEKALLGQPGPNDKKQPQSFTMSFAAIEALEKLKKLLRIDDHTQVLEWMALHTAEKYSDYEPEHLPKIKTELRILMAKKEIENMNCSIFEEVDPQGQAYLIFDQEGKRHSRPMTDRLYCWRKVYESVTGKKWESLS